LQLARIDQALADLDRPGYGSCQSCGQPIGWPRIQALPGTTRCVLCA
jgi:DnaK suppressor protein